jgi:acyl carrier protein
LKEIELVLTPNNDALTQPITCDVIEKIVRDFLRSEMSIVVDAIDFDTPLFELGLDSLGAASIAAALEDKFEKRMNPEVLFELDTIRHAHPVQVSRHRYSIRERWGMTIRRMPLYHSQPCPALPGVRSRTQSMLHHQPQPCCCSQ